MSTENLPAELAAATQPLTWEEPLTEQTVLLQVIARAAQDKTIDLDRMERLLVMHERLNARRAEREFTEAMAEFKLNPPRIIKSKRVSFTHRDGGGKTEYVHATLGDVCDAAIEGLAKVGISHSWDMEQKDGRVFVTCILTHRGGHSTRTAMNGAPDDSGKKNPVQQVASTVSYLQRYTLLAATGLATQEDTDGLPPEAAPARAPEPTGYANWKADMELVEGSDALAKAWEGSNAIFRGYAVSMDAEWWQATKRKAAGRR
jgi:hypothetical protein